MRDRLCGLIGSALARQEAAEAIAVQGMSLNWREPDSSAAFQREEVARWAAIMRTAKIAAGNLTMNLASTLASAVPAPDVLAAYTVACFALFIIPGPKMSLFLAKTIAEGRRAGLFAMLGAMAGCCIHTPLAPVGVSALLTASAAAFATLKVGGASYLLWLAIDAVRNGSALRLRSTGRERLSGWSTFVVGLGVNLTNPKTVLSFVTFLPQFVNAGNADAPNQIVFLGL